MGAGCEWTASIYDRTIKVKAMHTVKDVNPIDNHILLITFDTGEKKMFDVSPYLDKGIFTELKSTDYFKKVKVFLGSISWPNGQDFDPDHLFMESYSCT